MATDKLRGCICRQVTIFISCLLTALDNYRDKQRSSILKRTNAKGRRTHNVGKKVTKSPEIKTVQGRSIRKEENPYKRMLLLLD